MVEISVVEPDDIVELQLHAKSLADCGVHSSSSAALLSPRFPVC